MKHNSLAYYLKLHPISGYLDFTSECTKCSRLKKNGRR